MKKWITVFSLLLFAHLTRGQRLSDSTQLFLLTCSPGAELFSKFGHSAIRAYDPTTATDVVFNYGVFNFNTPNFYPKFIRGQLDYMLGAENTDTFFRAYGSEGREVKQQKLNLTPNQTRRVVRFLLKNYEPENRYYRYDFFFDNCATRIRDILEVEFDIGLVSPVPAPNNLSYRQLVDQYIAPFPWADFGIDLILGLPADQKADFRGEMFLPEYLANHFAEIQFMGNDLIENERIVVPQRIDHLKPSEGVTPVFICWILLVLVSVVSLWSGHKILRILDSFFFLLIGLAGCLFIFMWLGTEHKATWQNFNLLWASPFWLLGLIPTTKIGRLGLTIGTVGTLITCLGFAFIPQQLHPAVIPLALLLALRGTDNLFSWTIPLKKRILSLRPQ